MSIRILKGMDLPWWLIAVGVGVGAFGTLIGAGGGFILVPLLLLIYPSERPEVIASISLAVVFCNAASGSWAYARMGRIDYRAALVFSLASLPGAALGALTTSVIPRRAFDGVLGLLLICASVLLSQRRGTGPVEETESYDDAPGDGSAVPRDVDVFAADRTCVGYAPVVRQNEAIPRARALWLGSALSVAVGFVSSVLGIGGGIIHVPALVRILRFRVHVATATSHLILAFMALTGTIVHIATGSFTHGWRRTAMLAIGVVIGAQWGARWSRRVHGRLIVRALAVALILVGLRLVTAAAWGARE